MPHHAASTVLSLQSQARQHHSPAVAVGQCAHSTANQGSSSKPQHWDFLLGHRHVGMMDGSLDDLNFQSLWLH